MSLDLTPRKRQEGKETCLVKEDEGHQMGSTEVERIPDWGWDWDILEINQVVVGSRPTESERKRFVFTRPLLLIESTRYLPEGGPRPQTRTRLVESGLETHFLRRPWPLSLQFPSSGLFCFKGTYIENVMGWRSTCQISRSYYTLPLSVLS